MCGAMLGAVTTWDVLLAFAFAFFLYALLRSARAESGGGWWAALRSSQHAPWTPLMGVAMAAWAVVLMLSLFVGQSRLLEWLFDGSGLR